MRICAVVVAGGRSSRMGREKAFEVIRGRSILQRILVCLEGQVQAVAINANGDVGRFKAPGRAVVADLRSDIGTPLAGLHAAMAHAKANGFDRVLTTPSDSPFLPADLVERLAAAGGQAAIAASDGQAHYLTGLWSPDLLPQLAASFEQPRIPRLQDWVRMCGAAVVEWPAEPFDPFFNVNTPEELAQAERIAAEFGL